MTSRGWLPSVVRSLIVLLAALGLLLAVVTTTPLVLWWATLLAGQWNDPGGDVLIVLGADVLDTGVIGASSYWRAAYAASAFREGKFRQVVVSGGSKKGIPAAGPMARFLECYGVPHQAILLETQSKSTRENALYTKQLLANVPGRKVLLTSDYHMFRAYRTFRKAGLEVLPRPFPDIRKRGGNWMWRWGTFLELTFESLKIAYYYARGWI